MSSVEYKRFPHGERCSTTGCRSRRYYIESGAQFCKDHGHRQEGYVQVVADEDDFLNQLRGRKTRRKRDTYEERANSKVLEGTEAKLMYLLCLQLVLRKQIRALEGLLTVEGEHEDGLGPVVKSLWDLRLRRIKGLDSAQQGRNRAGVGSDGDGSQSEGPSLYSSATSGRDSESDVSTSSRGDSGRRRRKVRLNGMPKLIETLGLCYLGCVLKRLPISLGELLRWAENEEVTFLRVIREIPKEMHSQLPGYYIAALETRMPLRPDDLHRSVLEQVISLRDQCELILPPLNGPLLIFKHVRGLCLPLEVYLGTRNLARVLDVCFAWPDTSGRHQVSAWPELQLMAMIVIATKLSMALDGVKRVPQSMDDPAVLQIDWDEWMKTFKEPQRFGLQKGDEISLDSESVLKMDAKSMDQYMDWYQRTWLDDRDQKLPEQILELFPLIQLPSPTPPSEKSRVEASEKEEQVEQRLKITQASLQWTRPVPQGAGREGQEMIRPGMAYRHWRRAEELPPPARDFYEQAAKLAGVSVETLVRAVFLIEIKLQQHIEKMRRERLIADWEGIEEDKV